MTTSFLRPRPSIWIRVALLSVAVFAAALGSGCAHQTMITTTTPGAEVYVEGEKIGNTPVALNTTSSFAGDVHFDVRQNGESKRFSIPRERFSTSALLGSVALGLSLFGAGTALTFGSALGMTLGAIIAPVNPQAAVIAILGSTVVMTLGVLLSGYSLATPVLFIGEMGRALPDRVDVDWVTGDVRTSPPVTARPLIGTVPGFRPHRPTPGADEGYE